MKLVHLVGSIIKKQIFIFNKFHIYRFFIYVTQSSTSEDAALTVPMSTYCIGAVTEGNGHELVKVLVRVECLRKTLNSSSTKTL